MVVNRPTVLVVDDHADTLRMVEQLLRGHGLEVYTATNVQSVVEAAKAHKFDLLVSDLCLGDGDGCELLCHLRTHGPLPAVAMTGRSDAVTEWRAQAVGFDRVLIKPFLLEVLLAAIRDVLAEAARRVDGEFNGSRTGPEKGS